MSEKWTFDKDNKIMLKEEKDRPVNKEIAPFLHSYNGMPCIYIIDPHDGRSIYRVPCDYKYWPLCADMEFHQMIRYAEECGNDEYTMYDEDLNRDIHAYIPFHFSDYESYWWNQVAREEFEIHPIGLMKFLRISREDDIGYLLPLGEDGKPLAVPEKK